MPGRAGVTPPLIAIVGATATGKTPLAVALARRLGRAELVNADSRQVIRGLRVGTCAPTPEELGEVPCHLLDCCEPGERFTVADWASRAAPLLDQLAARAVTAVLVGGTGLYVSAAVDGLELGAPPDPEVRRARDALSETSDGLQGLAAELAARDPDGAREIDLRNRRRVVRALELVDAAGSVAAGRRRGPGRAALQVGLDASPELHRRLIVARSERMLRSGALQREVAAVLAAGVSEAALDRAGIGYREALALRAGRLDLDEAVTALTLRTLRYAKAQRTWFRRDPRIRWLRCDEGDADALAGAVLGMVG